MKPILLTILLATLSAPVCFGEWTRYGGPIVVNKGGHYNAGAVYSYIDFETIRERDGYVYWWGLRDNSNPIGRPGTMPIMSATEYLQGDCGIFRTKTLTILAYPEPMGRGNKFQRDKEPDENWTYHRPGSIGEIELTAVCDYVTLSEEDKK